MDNFLLFLFGHTYAVRYVPPYKWIDVTVESDKLFENEQWILSLGYVVCTVICIPFGVRREQGNEGRREDVRGRRGGGRRGEKQRKGEGRDRGRLPCRVVFRLEYVGNEGTKERRKEGGGGGRWGEKHRKGEGRERGRCYRGEQ
jgi:hypothetical protein